MKFECHLFPFSRCGSVPPETARRCFAVDKDNSTSLSSIHIYLQNEFPPVEKLYQKLPEFLKPSQRVVYLHINASKCFKTTLQEQILLDCHWKAEDEDDFTKKNERKAVSVGPSLSIDTCDCSHFTSGLCFEVPQSWSNACAYHLCERRCPYTTRNRETVE